MHVLRQASAGPQPRERPDAATLAELGVVEMREGEHLGAGADADVFQHAVRSHPDVVAEAHAALEHAVDVDRNVAAALERAAHVDARRVGQRHAGLEQPPRFAPLPDALQHGELLHGIDAGDFPLVLGLDGEHRHGVGHGERHQIGEVILVLRIVIADLRQPWREPPRAQAKKPGIDFADGELARRGILLLDDARDALRRVAHDAAIARRVVELGDNDAYAPASALDQAPQCGRPHQRHIAVQDQHVRVGRYLRQRLQHGVAGAELLGLQNPIDPGIGKRGAHALGAMTMHDEHPARRERARGVEHMGEQRPAGKRMKHLGKLRAHALAQAGGQYDHVERHHADSRLILRANRRCSAW